MHACMHMVILMFAFIYSFQIISYHHNIDIMECRRHCILLYPDRRDLSSNILLSMCDECMQILVVCATRTWTRRKSTSRSSSKQAMFAMKAFGSLEHWTPLHTLTQSSTSLVHMHMLKSNIFLLLVAVYSIISIIFNAVRRQRTHSTILACIITWHIEFSCKNNLFAHADDDNAYDARLFDEMLLIKKVCVCIFIRLMSCYLCMATVARVRKL